MTMSNICLLLTCLLIPLFIGLFDVQSKLSLSSTGHIIAEILIMLAIYWLILLIDRFDRWLYLRSLLTGELKLLEQHRFTKTSVFISETSIPSDFMNNENSTEQFEKLIPDSSRGITAHETRVTIGKLFHKNGQ